MIEFKEKYDGDFEQNVLFNLNITITVVKTGEWIENLLTGKETVKSMIEQLYAVKNLLEQLFIQDRQDIKEECILGDWKQIRYFYLILDCQELNFLNIVNKMEVFRKWRNQKNTQN